MRRKGQEWRFSTSLVSRSVILLLHCYLYTPGQFGPFIGTALYPESDKPYYVHGMAACAGFMLLVGKSLITPPSAKKLLYLCKYCIIAALSLWLRRILQKTNDAMEKTTYSVIHSEGNGDNSPGEDGKLVEKTRPFRYIL